jgi:hypothetical protein
MASTTSSASASGERCLSELDAVACRRRLLSGPAAKARPRLQVAIYLWCGELERALIDVREMDVYPGLG